MSSTSTSTSSSLEDIHISFNQMIEIMDQVYGSCPEGEQSSTWKPRPYQENKSRYLWTDAFGVCNFLTLFLETGKEKFLQQAKCLIKAVHDTLGKDRSGTHRLGSSTDDHPLLGGLRIGKRDASGPDGDGQYFHYLTKWMFALNRMSLVTSDLKYNRWAIELIKSIHPHFVLPKKVGDQMKKRMVWKISTDLNQILVPSAGNLDPFDGYITYRLIQNLAEDPAVLNQEIADMKTFVMEQYPRYASQDPLDLGEALWIAHFFASEEEWAQHIVSVSLSSLEWLWKAGYFSQPLNRRLAFREFGTTIGLQVTKDLSNEWKDRIQKLHDNWLPKLWKRDSDITPVMFCTSLCPGIFGRNYLELKKTQESGQHQG